MVRIWNLWYMYTDETEAPKYRQYALIGLLRLLVGKDMASFQWNTLASSPSVVTLREHVENLMKGVVERRFMKWYGDSIMSNNSETSWLLQPFQKGHALSVIRMEFLTASMLVLARLSLYRYDKLQLYQSAILSRGLRTQGRGSHERLCRGDIIQVLLQKRSIRKLFLTNLISTVGTPHFFIVGGFV